jgi:flagellar protein FliS
MNASTAYRQLEVRGNDPVHLVVLLYDQLIRHLSAAAEAVSRADVVARTHEIDHAMAVVGHLQATLNLDQGREVAANLRRFYDALRDGLLTAQLQSSADLLRKHIGNVIMVREAWAEVERQGRSTARALSNDRGTYPQSDDSPAGGDWEA